MSIRTFRCKTRPLTCAVLGFLMAGATQAADDAQVLPAVVVKSAVAPVEKYQLPQTVESTTARRVAETVNAVDTEDAVKYLPSLFVRKRNFGDTQPVLATRTWGVGSSARSLVYADDVLISALVANNNTLGAPRWGLVAPEEIARIDVLYGPFAAAYPGNSMGAVMQITTRMPEKFEASVSQTEALQSFKQYGTDASYRTDQTAVTLGNRDGAFAWWLSANHQNSHSQPLSYVTNGSVPAGTRGTFIAQNKLGAVANVVGASGLLHTQMDNIKAKLSLDLAPGLTAYYTLGMWRNNADAQVQTYLKNAAGQPTFGGVSGFASGFYNLLQEQTSHSLALKSDNQSGWAWEGVYTRYNYDTDRQRSPGGVTGTTSFTRAGKLALLNGTNWQTLDLKAVRRGATAHEVSFGGHHDQYELVNPTYNTSEWTAGNGTTLFTDSRGKTRTRALWAQDVWTLAPALKATLGGRYERWQAFDGYNYNSTGNKGVKQAAQNASNFSPKLSLAWDSPLQWLVTASYGKAYRYPTVAELYQLVQTGSVFTSPNANLRPERVNAVELAFEKSLTDGRLRVSLFQEDVADALIGQNAYLGTPAVSTNFVQNVDRLRNRGVEIAFQQNHVGLRGLEISGSLTYVDSRILVDTTWVSPPAPALQNTTVVGKHAPNVPDWRATLVATYRPDDKLAYTAAARYSGRQFSTLDNTDVNGNVYGAFDRFFVIDAKLLYRIDAHWTGSVGIDNLNNYKYTLFHPFPQRTLVGQIKYSY